ncbi:hypothetical protein G6F31_017736 [Rhizopus arrhizus]|nr:hypothetical protein G6F31_017736 [Rhizopus arrhizus]
MSLMGDAMSHAILPGVAAGFLLSGLSLGAMMLGGIATGLAVALLAGLVARLTPLREDASFAAFYLISLGLGVLLVSLRGSNMDLLHVLQRDLAGAGGELPPAGGRMPGPQFSARQRRRGRLGPHELPGAGGREPGGGLSGAGHLDGGRDHDAARGRRPLLGAFGGPADSAGRGVWRAGVPPLQPAVAAADAAAGTPQPRAGPGRGARSHRAGARRLPARIEHV